MGVLQKDREILIDLAKRQQEYANSERNKNTIKRWYAHNACQGESPMIHLEMWTFQDEVIPKRLRCEGEEARKIEMTLYDNFLNFELFKDDRPVIDYYPVHWYVGMTPFNLEVTAKYAENSQGHEFKHYIEDLEEDYDKLGETQINLDRVGTINEMNFVNDIFGDVLPAKIISDALYSVPTQNILHIMSMETMYVAMMDYPELFKKMMERIANDTLQYFRFLEKENLLLPTVSDENLGQGTWCYNNELPSTADKPLITKNLWGFMDSQETVGISPEMYGEFIFPCYEKISKEFGLLSYGCCEMVNPIWDPYVSKLSNLRKVSISPWCDEEFMGERLRGKKIIFHRKPSPNFLGVGNTFDEQGFREHIRKTLKAAKGCTLEITQRDVYSINNDENRAIRFVEIIREEIENNW